MSHTLSQLTEEALKLPPVDRVFLAESLLLTIDAPREGSVDEATMVELDRRLRDFREGRVVGVPVDQALREIREALKRAP